MYIVSVISEYIYRYGLYAYAFLLRFAALWNSKAALMTNGRKQWQLQVSQFKAVEKRPIFWIHVASLGEFEQARPVIESIQIKYPDAFAIVVTFFSSSGYEIRKNYTHAALVMYLPFDSPSASKQFIELLNPGFAIFVKYDFWYYYLSQLRLKGIPTFLISSTFRPEQIFFQPYGVFFRKMLACFNAIFVQDFVSLTLLRPMHNQVSISGDTRFDRVKQVYDQRKHIEIIQNFKGNSRLLVCGSTWESDLNEIMPVLLSDVWREKHNVKVVLVPHDVNAQTIKITEKKCQGKFIRYTQYQASKSPFLIVDQVGFLSSIYQYADVVYIGGGFGKSIHNTLEAAVYGVPVCFGPAHKKFTEAQDLLRIQAAVAIQHNAEWRVWIEKILDQENLRNKMSEAAKQYVWSKTGATSRILLYLESQYPEYFT